MFGGFLPFTKATIKGKYMLLSQQYAVFALITNDLVWCVYLCIVNGRKQIHIKYAWGK